MKIVRLWCFSLLILSYGCTTSKITTTWKADNIIPPKFKKIMVLSLIREADRSIQQKMENHFVGDLKELGYDAVSSLQEYGPKAFDKMTEEEAISKLKSGGVDAVITIVLLDKIRERNYIPNRINNSPYGYYQNRFWGYQGTLYNRIYEPGYYVIDTKYFWEGNLYEMNTQKLIYSVQTQSFDPANSEVLGHEYGKMIVKRMVNDLVLQP
jgi:hypothetical protein